MADTYSLAGCSNIYAISGLSYSMKTASALAQEIKALMEKQGMRLGIVVMPTGPKRGGVGQSTMFDTVQDALESLGGYVVENTVSAHNKKGVNIWVVPGNKTKGVEQAAPEQVQRAKTNMVKVAKKSTAKRTDWKKKFAAAQLRLAALRKKTTKPKKKSRKTRG